MSQLRGKAMGAGTALGISVLVQSKNGLPLFPSIPPSVMQRLASRKLTEKADVVLVARDLATGLSFVDSITWAQVVGIAAESDEFTGPYPNFPVVLGIPHLLEMVQQDILVLVNADRGIVEAEPDIMRLAQFQAEHDHIAPKRRLYLDDVHLPAQTIDGHTIQVIASVSTELQLVEAIAQGTDSLYIPFDCGLLPDDNDELNVRNKMLRLVELAGGKPLIISDNYAIPALLLLEASSLAEITVAVPPRYDLEGFGLTELEAMLVESETESDDSELLIGMPRLAADVAYDPKTLASGEVQEWVNSIAFRGAQRLIFHQIVHTTDLYYFDVICAAATSNTIPVFLDTPQFVSEVLGSELGGRDIRLIMGCGTGGFIIPPNDVSEFKQAIRSASFADCRQEMWSFLK